MSRWISHRTKRYSPIRLTQHGVSISLGQDEYNNPINLYIMKTYTKDTKEPIFKAQLGTLTYNADEQKFSVSFQEPPIWITVEDLRTLKGRLDELLS